MDERVKFIGRVLDGEKISALCEEFGISRKTGYKIHKLGCHVILTNSNHPLVHEQYKKFTIEVIQTKRYISCNGKGSDLVFEFENFVLGVEVTLTESSRQEAAEGESVKAAYCPAEV